LPAIVVEAASPVDVDARGVVVPVGAGLDIDALAEGEEEGVGPTGADVGVVDVWVGSVGEVTAVELRFVVPGLFGLDVGALSDGEEMGADLTGADVGVVDVWVGPVGDVTGVGDPVGGTETGCCGEADVGVGAGG